MTHDYSERMSLALDGRLTVQERADLHAHLATCSECRARWAAFQQVDHVLSNATLVSPAPGFAARFAARLARQSQFSDGRAAQRVARLPQSSDRGRIWAGIGVFAAGAVALALLIVPALVSVWYNVGQLAAGAPTLLGQWVEAAARWLVTLRAVGEVGQSALSVMGAFSGPILMGYALMLVLVTTAWVSVMRSMSRRRNVIMLPALIWF